MNRSWFSSIRVRLLALLALLFVCALAIMVYSALERRERAARNAEDDVALLARVTAAQHEQTLESARHLLAALAQLPAVRSRDAERCSAQYLPAIVTRSAGGSVARFATSASYRASYMAGRMLSAMPPSTET